MKSDEGETYGIKEDKHHVCSYSFSDDQRE